MIFNLFVLAFLASEILYYKKTSKHQNKAYWISMLVFAEMIIIRATMLAMSVNLNFGTQLMMIMVGTVTINTYIMLCDVDWIDDMVMKPLGFKSTKQFINKVTFGTLAK